MSLRIAGKAAEFRAQDVSVLGIGFTASGAAFALGEVISFDLVEDGRTVLKGLSATVVRSENDNVGCSFENLDRSTENAIYNLVIARQKPLLSSR